MDQKELESKVILGLHRDYIWRLFKNMGPELKRRSRQYLRGWLNRVAKAIEIEDLLARVAALEQKLDRQSAMKA